ncbi:metallo-beta-lactamase domain-containing protein [Cardiosporidium cionae]|uniref:Metallo-beta-lactamase domain-containing protein n=1 Tax=Cardiosporidium cionae TaxID=476202 RepID=A0ABQ7JBA2_9APIC|nr:metallo-beta-lactamase domain-containing protein [Cardiosporidium cionae]|eukprot:KAF8821272.1 metallo-beta-lactamase domain-containing protein [Cardiosporidium cionae]
MYGIPMTESPIQVTVLGAGQDVGRSCVVVRAEGKTIIFDCGYHMGFNDERKYPQFGALVALPSPHSVPHPLPSEGSRVLSANHTHRPLSSRSLRPSMHKYYLPHSTHTPLKRPKFVPFLSRVSTAQLIPGSVKERPPLSRPMPLPPHQPPFTSSTYTHASSIPTIKELLLNAHDFNSVVDCVIISHFHLDHCGALPFFTERLGYHGPIFMTYPTKALAPVLLIDSARISAARWDRKKMEMQNTKEVLLPRVDPLNYTEKEVVSCMHRVTPLQLHETFTFGSIRITAYYAGHVLGASIIDVRIKDTHFVYTGDYNTTPDRHLGCARIPRLRPHVLISESTYASYVRQSKRSTERDFCMSVQKTLEKGAKILIPVFAVGRAQELCILLEQYWQKMQLTYPIYFGGGMTEKANKYYKLYANWTRLDNPSYSANIFDFPNISPFNSDFLGDPRPMVLFATPGMLHAGLALKALKAWAADESNLVIIPGYCVQGTIGNKLISGEKRIQLDPSTVIDVKCKIKYMSFSAHADTVGIQQLIRQVDPQNVVLVHGEKDGMEKLAVHLEKSLEIKVATPANGQTVNFYGDSPHFPVFIHSLNIHSSNANATFITSPPVAESCRNSSVAEIVAEAQVRF